MRKTLKRIRRVKLEKSKMEKIDDCTSFVKFVLVIFCFLIICPAENSSSNNTELLITKIEEETFTGLNFVSTPPALPKTSINICCQKEGTQNISDCSGNSTQSRDNFVKPYNSSRLHFDFRFHYPCNNGTYYLIPPFSHQIDNDSFYLFDNGTLRIRWITNSIKYEEIAAKNDYCFFNPMKDESEVIKETHTSVAICQPAETLNFPDKFDEVMEMMTIISFSLSLPFSIATIAIYAWIPELRNFRGIILMMYVTSLFGFQIQNILWNIDDLTASQNICYILRQYMALCVHFWANILSFDIWTSFRRSVPILFNKKQRKKLIIYLFYGWGCPAIFTSISLISKFAPEILGESMEPKFDMEDCWYELSDSAYWILFLYPIAAVSICLSLLYVLTGWNIYQQKKDIANYHKDPNSQRHDENKHWFNLHIKLFVVMGICYVLRLIQFMLVSREPHLLKYIAELYYGLQGFIIFLVVVVNNKVKRLLLNRLRNQDKSSKRTSDRVSSSLNDSRSSTKNTVGLKRKNGLQVEC